MDGWMDGWMGWMVGLDAWQGLSPCLRRRLLFGHGLLSDEVASSLSDVVAASSGERGGGNPCKLWLYAEPSAFELQVRVQLIGHL